MRDAQFKVISVIDPALDTLTLTVEQIRAYMNGRDFSIVDGHWVPGEKPTIFHVREVPHDLWESYVMSSTSSDAERHLRAFIAGVVRVENLIGDDGVSLTNWEPAGRRGEHVMMTAAESKRFAPSEREEIGSVIYNHSFLPRKTQLYSQLPSSVVEHLARREFRLAAPSQTTASAQSSEKHSASSGQTPIETATTTAISGAV